MKVPLLSAIAAAVLIAGCAGAPPVREKLPTGESPAGEETPSGVGRSEEAYAAKVILDARNAAQSGDLRKASTMLEDLLSSQEYNIEALRLLAKVYSSLGERSSASETWIRLSELDPTDPDAAYEAGSALARKKAWKELRTRMLAAGSAGAADQRHYALLGRADVELGYDDEAEKYLRMAGGIEISQALLGELYYGRGKLSLAQDAFLKTLEINPLNFSANLHLGYIQFGRGRLQKAMEYYKTAYRSDPSNPLGCLSLASLYEKMNDDAKAIEYYEKAISLEGIPRAEKIKVYVTLSRLLVGSGRYSETSPIVKKGLVEFPDSGGLYFYWGEALLRLGNGREAKEKFKRAAQDPSWKKPALSRFHSIR